MRFGYPTEPATLDPLGAGGGSAATRDILRPVLPALFRLDEDLKPQPDLVAAWPEAEAFAFDPFTVRLDLRRATWSDEKPITAGDVRFTWSKLKDGPAKWRYRFLRDVEVVDADTFRLRFDRVVRRWWSLFSVDDMVLPAHAYSDLWRDGPTVSGGPFAFVEWTRGLRIRLERNEAYGRVVPLRGIDVLFVPSDETRLQLLQRGELDLFASEGDSNVGRRANAYGLGATTSSAWGPAWYQLELDTDALGPTVAQAIVEAASSDLAAEILEDSGRPMEGIPADFSVGRAVAQPWKGRGNLEVAKQVLRGARKTFRLTFPAAGAAGTLANHLHFRLRGLGLVAELSGLEPDAFDRSPPTTPVVLRLVRGADAPDAGAYLAAGGIDDQVVQAETATTAARLVAGSVTGLHAEGWTAAQRHLADTGSVAPLAQVRSFLVGREGVVGAAAKGAADGPMWNAIEWRIAA